MHTALSFPARRSLLAATLLALLSACASTTPQPVSVADTVARTAALSTLQGLVTSAGLTQALQAAGPLTLFAPSNDAFKDVPAKTMEDLAHHPDKLKALLSYHVVPAKVMAADVKSTSVKTLHGAEVSLSKAGDFLTIENAAVTQADIIATNGVVHVIDTVLLPPAKK